MSALMTQYAQGQLTSRQLHEMLHEYAALVRSGLDTSDIVGASHACGQRYNYRVPQPPKQKEITT